MKVVVTGASGFVGNPVCRALVDAGMTVVGTVRRPLDPVPGATLAAVGDLGPDTDWAPALKGADAVVHLAARAHVMGETEADPLTVFRRVNRDGAVRLAEQAAVAGVRRLVFISSIKVNGEVTPPDRPFTAATAAPVDPYGIAKWEAEQALAAVAARTRLELVVIRPPLVHGPGAKGNLAAMMRVVDAGWPLPLGAIANRRSLVGVHNLADAIRFCLITPEAAGKTLLVRDGTDVSTPELIAALAALLGRRARLLPVPPALLRLAGLLTGKSAAVSRLTGSLVVDDTPLRALGWQPRETLAQGLAAMAAAYRRSTH